MNNNNNLKVESVFIDGNYFSVYFKDYGVTDEPPEIHKITFSDSNGVCLDLTDVFEDDMETVQRELEETLSIDTR